MLFHFSFIPVVSWSRIASSFFCVFYLVRMLTRWCHASWVRCHVSERLIIFSLNFAIKDEMKSILFTRRNAWPRIPASEKEIKYQLSWALFLTSFGSFLACDECRYLASTHIISIILPSRANITHITDHSQLFLMNFLYLLPHNTATQHEHARI